eukprot:TRINITY_DN663_c0_g1_i1.p1 TRINITY_DN663_c0_g1~~TRINITY_DN663_c0_g1_i1.p1  ORF type:complete len:1075 (-),score=271.53 TRINITY_DN663_c0_g1_i1:55-3009(-)
MFGGSIIDGANNTDDAYSWNPWTQSFRKIASFGQSYDRVVAANGVNVLVAVQSGRTLSYSLLTLSLLWLPPAFPARLDSDESVVSVVTTLLYTTVMIKSTSNDYRFLHHITLTGINLLFQPSFPSSCSKDSPMLFSDGVTAYLACADKSNGRTLLYSLDDVLLIWYKSSISAFPYSVIKNPACTWLGQALGTFYFLNNNGSVYRLRSSSGIEAAESSIAGGVYSPTCFTNGDKMYFFDPLSDLSTRRDLNYLTTDDNLGISDCGGILLCKLQLLEPICSLLCNVVDAVLDLAGGLLNIVTGLLLDILGDLLCSDDTIITINIARSNDSFTFGGINVNGSVRAAGRLVLNFTDYDLPENANFTVGPLISYRSNWVGDFGIVLIFDGQYINNGSISNTLENYTSSATDLRSVDKRASTRCQPKSTPIRGPGTYSVQVSNPCTLSEDGGSAGTNSEEGAQDPNHLDNGVGSSQVGVIAGSVVGGVAGVAGTVGVVAILFFVVVRRRQKRQDNLVDLASQADFKLKKHELKDVEIHERLGAGSFGEVFVGIWNGNKVACKKTKEEDAKEFENEIATLSEVVHPNIVQYYGSTNVEGHLWLVMEYMSYGSLDNIIKKNALKLGTLVDIARQACAGMLHLSLKNIIHRDLALRNVLVCQGDKRQLRVKLADFGMSRSSSTGHYTSSNTIFPLKWCSVEVLEYNQFSSASDVWAFGILLWELFSDAQEPYPDQTPQKAAKAVVGGYRMTIPSHVPKALADLMARSWALKVTDRPTFQEFSECLQQCSIDHPKPEEDLNLKERPISVAIKASALAPMATRYESMSRQSSTSSISVYSSPSASQYSLPGGRDSTVSQYQTPSEVFESDDDSAMRDSMASSDTYQKPSTLSNQYQAPSRSASGQYQAPSRTQSQYQTPSQNQYQAPSHGSGQYQMPQLPSRSSQYQSPSRGSQISHSSVRNEANPEGRSMSQYQMRPDRPPRRDLDKGLSTRGF